MAKLALTHTQGLQVLVNVISGGLTPSFTSEEAEQMGAKIISECSSKGARMLLTLPSLLFGFLRGDGPRIARGYEVTERDGN